MTELDSLLETLGHPSEFKGMKPGLERICALCQLLGNPQKNFTAVQIVGTNGKGSTAFYLAQMLNIAFGGGIGSFYSPHLLKFNERIRVNNEPVSDEVLLAALKTVLAAGEQLTEKPSFFEIITAAAFLIFARAGVKIAVLEAGLGGRLDATTAAGARFGIITEVGLDHCHILGNTIPEIFREKLAAFNNETELVLVAPQPAAAYQELQKSAITNIYLDNAEEPVNIIGRYRRKALAVAKKAAAIICQAYGQCLPDDIIGRLDCNFPGRLHLVQQNPPVIVDISHNPPAIAELMRALTELPGYQPVERWLIMFGAMQDKNYAAELRLLAPIAQKFLLPAIPGSRAAKPEELLAVMPQNIDSAIYPDIATACTAARDLLKDVPYRGLLICGSNFLAGPALANFLP